MGLLKEITDTIHADKELVEGFDAYLAEIEANLPEKKFTILTEMPPGDRPFRSTDARAEQGVAQDLALGHEEERKRRAMQGDPFIIVRKADGTYTGTKREQVEFNAAGTKSARFKSKSGDIWFDPDDGREATPQEKEQMAAKAPKLAAGNFKIYNQMT